MTEDNPGLLASTREVGGNGSKRLDLENIDGTLDVLMLCLVEGTKPRVLNRRLLCFFCVLFQNQNYF